MRRGLPLCVCVCACVCVCVHARVGGVLEPLVLSGQVSSMEQSRINWMHHYAAIGAHDEAMGMTVNKAEEEIVMSKKEAGMEVLLLLPLIYSYY